MELVRSVYELLEREYGVALMIEQNPVVAAVGVADVIIAPNNPRRLSLVVVNLSANVVLLRPQEPAVLTSGIFLGPLGGTMAINFHDDQHLPALEWHAIATGVSDILVVGTLIR